LIGIDKREEFAPGPAHFVDIVLTASQAAFAQNAVALCPPRAAENEGVYEVT
jgi:hypothetical protein